jgi:2-methylisocitrate lyase-like PEP mutase family enzyme
MTMARRLRVLLAENKPLLAAGVFDALSSRIAEDVGYKALHVGGFAVESALLGRPDIGMITLTELTDQVARITATVDVPVIVDVDTGFGGVHNVARTVFELERAGAVGLHIEDQIIPKKCPLLDGRVLVPEAVAVSRIKAALDARRDPDFLIIARCDADSVSYDELVRRSNLYLEAGADMVLPMLLEHNGARIETLPPGKLMDLYRQLARDIHGPLLNVMIPPGSELADFREAGYALVSNPATSLQAAANAMYAVLTEALTNGTGTKYLKDNSQFVPTPRKIMDLMKVGEFITFEQKHQP